MFLLLNISLAKQPLDDEGLVAIETVSEQSKYSQTDFSYECYKHVRSSKDASSVTPFEQLALPAPRSSASKSHVKPANNPNIDLLSGDDFFKPEPVHSQALVPVSNQPAASASSSHSLDLLDMFSDTNAINNSSQNPATPPIPNTNPNPSAPEAYPAPQQPVPPQHPSPYSNGLNSNTLAPYDQGSNLTLASSWNGQFAPGMVPPQQAPNYGIKSVFFNLSF